MFGYAQMHRPRRPKTDAQRRREANERKKAQGLVQVAVWVPVEHKEEIKEIAKRWEMSKAFVDRFIVTKDDGHDFYPYDGRVPTADEVREYMEGNMSAVFENHLTWALESERNTEAAAIAAMQKRWSEDTAYREQCIADACEYITDVDFD